MATTGTANTTKAPYPTGKDGLVYFSTGLLSVGNNITTIVPIPIPFDCNVAEIVSANITVTNDPSLTVGDDLGSPTAILAATDFVGTTVQNFLPAAVAATVSVKAGGRINVTVISDADAVYLGSILIGVRPARG